MKYDYSISGMTCGGCVASLTKILSEIDGVDNVSVDLKKGKAEIEMGSYIPLKVFSNSLSSKYSIKEVGDFENLEREAVEKQSKLQQLKPLFLIFVYLFTAAFLLNFKDWNTREAMLDFMGLFYIVFSFFKFLDLKGFPGSFRMYDPLAKAIPTYGWIYPFIELSLGLLFLMRFKIEIALIATIVILGLTTFGVTKTLLNKKSIQCACLGTALKLPMTEATFIENAIMLVMAISMFL